MFDRYNVGIFGKVTNDQTTALPHMVAQHSADYIDSPINYNDYDGLLTSGIFGRHTCEQLTA